MSDQPKNNGIHAIVMVAAGSVHVHFPEGGISAAYVIDELRESPEYAAFKMDGPEGVKLEILATARFTKACLMAAAPFEVEAGKLEEVDGEIVTSWAHLSNHRTLGEAVAEMRRHETRPIRNLRIAGEDVCVLSTEIVARDNA